jgi:hypothetical protein
VLADARLDLRAAARGVADGEATGTGWPGLVTSDAFPTGGDSGSCKTYRTGAVTARVTSCAVSQPTKLVAISANAQRLQFIALLYERLFFSATISDKTVDLRLRRRP